jgi:PAS domain S-box-containing protein
MPTMKSKGNRPNDVAELRRRAEDKARSAEPPGPEALSLPVGRRFEVPAGVEFHGSPAETRRLLHELHVHEIELEMQNEELRRAGAELDAARARYFDLYDVAPVGYVTISEPGIVLEANLTATNLLGVTRGALVRRPITPFILSEDQDIYYSLRRQLFATGEPQTCELRMVRSDGTDFWACLEAAVQDPSPRSGQHAASACRVVLSDITGRKQTEAALNDSLQRNRALLDANPDMFFVFTADGRIVDAKAERPDDLYLSPAEFLDKRVDEVLPPDVARQTLAFIAEAHRTDRLVQYNYTLQVQGEQRDFESRLVPCENGTFMAVVRNITERKRAEEALARTAEELARSNEEVRQFAYIVSHDLRGPLVNVEGFVSELRGSLADLERLARPAVEQLGETERERTDRILRQEVPEALEFIDSSVSRMDHLINALLRLSRLGRHELVLERLGLGSLVSEILTSLGTQIEARDAAVTVLPLPDVTADRTSLEQILGNILTNAVLYLDPTRPGRIEILGKLAGTDLHVSIRDNGRGIAPEDHDKVFAPFRRVDASDVPGEGMGLAYVQALVRRQGGRIWFDSEPGVGTTFSFVLPVALP